MEYIDLQITSSNTSKNVKWNTDPLDPSTSSEENATREEEGVFLSLTPPPIHSLFLLKQKQKE